MADTLAHETFVHWNGSRASPAFFAGWTEWTVEPKWADLDGAERFLTTGGGSVIREIYGVRGHLVTRTEAGILTKDARRPRPKSGT